MPRVLLDRAEIDEVQHRADGRVDAVIELAAFLVCQSHGLDEVGRALDVLLKKHRRVDAARPALQDRWSIFQKRHDVIGELQIETEQIEFSELLVGPVDAVEARQRHALAAHLKRQIAFGPVQTHKLLDRDGRSTLLSHSFYRHGSKYTASVLSRRYM